ncbi:MAG: Mrp/NBP35 family ATP-binding protein [Proteobacteria bacterium]|nr:Mrp/NBP35 family ATP-binding protein [Pseudomonadota bacterium]MBU1546257.1 Mrp/NBP35 family ATP-binding protein [Pseudomonadota bacterium]MBU2618203.1 Mrp/NBP35 family ATP-binding protein [Pseudomonadota bacterium]
MIEEKQVRQILQTVKHPKTQKYFLDLGLIRDIAVAGDTVSLTLTLKSERSPLRKGLEKQIDSALRALPGVSHVRIQVTKLSQEEWGKIFPPPVYKGIYQVKEIVAVTSGKGGVGKTTVAVNIALALAGQGLRVGLMDADIYGPSIPIMLDLTCSPKPGPEGMILPLEKYGLKIISLGMSAQQDEAFIWRGPLVAKMIGHLLGNVRWGGTRLSDHRPASRHRRRFHHHCPGHPPLPDSDGHHAPKIGPGRCSTGHRPVPQVQPYDHRPGGKYGLFCQRTRGGYP